VAGASCAGLSNDIESVRQAASHDKNIVAVWSSRSRAKAESISLDAYLRDLRELCDRHDILLDLKSSAAWAARQVDSSISTPGIQARRRCLLAKGLASAWPIGACSHAAGAAAVFKRNSRPPRGGSPLS